MENRQKKDEIQNSRDLHRIRSQSTRPTIGLLVENTSDMGQGYYPGILAGVISTIQARNANLLCFVGGSLYGLPGVEFDSQRNILYDIVSSNNLDGLIIISSIGNYRPIEELGKLYSRYYPLPAVSIGAPIGGPSNVTVDHKKGMRDALVHLIEAHNYQRIAFIAGPEDSPDARIRYQVYKETLAKYGLPLDPEIIVSGLFTFSSGKAAIRHLLDQRPVNFEVVVAANDHMALGALEELQARGIVVPYDVAVTGFDDIKQAINVVPPLTTVRQPLFEMGRQAVETLLAQIAQEAVPEQIILPTELVIRRSCGCLESIVASVTAQPITGAGETLAQILSMGREAIVSDLSQSVDFSPAVVPGWAEKLLDGFSDEVLNNSKGSFLSTLDRILRLMMREGGDVISWQPVVSVLRRHLMPGLKHDDLSQRVEALLHQARVFIDEETRKVEAHQHMQLEQQNWTLHDIGQSLITMFDLEGLIDIISDGLPRLSIPGCYLALYEDPSPYSFPQPPPEWSRLVLACDANGSIVLDPNGRRFLTRNLLPEGVLPKDRRYIMMVESLYFREEQIGFVLLERGPREGNVYEVLRAQIASALKGAMLLQAHSRAEEELRRHRDHLDELVQERTEELATANEHLHQEIEERRQAEVELERSNRELQEFASIASHDLQEPLRKIQTFGDRLQEKYRSNLDERGQDYIDRMQNAATRMQALIVDLLAYSRVRTHTQPFQKVNLYQVIMNVLRDLEVAIAEVGADIEVAKLPVIEVDAIQMQQLFQNLLSNSLKFRRPDVPLKVKIQNRKVDTFYEITVVDNGIGFEEQFSDRIFNMFERLHNRDTYPGTGVGLAICRRIVEHHEGYIRARSKPGEGATFIIGLPVNQP